MTPGPWTFALLALAAHRLYRLIARDTIAEPLRDALSYPDDSAVTLDDRPWIYDVGGRSRVRAPKPPRVYLATLLRCHWCLGWWISFATWYCWTLWPHATAVAAAPLAISSVVALLSKNLDA